MTVALVLAAALAVVCVAWIALPFLRDPSPSVDVLEELDPAELRRLQLEEARDRTLAALKELEADHRAGRLADADYRSHVGPLRREVAETLRALDEAEERPTGP